MRYMALGFAVKNEVIGPEIRASSDTRGKCAAIT